MQKLQYKKCSTEELTLKTLYCLCEVMKNMTVGNSHKKLLYELQKEISVEGEKFMKERAKLNAELDYLVNKL